MLIAADNMEKLLCVEMRRRGIPRGFKWRIYEVARETEAEPLMLAAARPLAGDAMRVALVTGAWVPEQMPVGESDGPYGTVVLARALQRIGHQVAIYTDPECAPPIEFLAHQLGSDAAVVGVERGAEAVNRGIVEASDAIVAIERLGQNPNGHLYSMNGFRLTDEQHAFDDCFRAMRAAGKPTISITDGGNEIGYGKIREALIQALPGLNLAERTECGGGIVCATDCDVLVVANSSNLGCYGVVGALALLREDASLCHRPEDEIALHHVGVGLGLIDGGGGGAVPWCDGIPAEASAALVLLVRNIVERALEQPRERAFRAGALHWPGRAASMRPVMTEYLYDETLKRRVAGNVAGFQARSGDANGRKRAAVAVVLVADDAGEGAVVVTKRVPRLRTHSGQWAMPGGRVDAGETPEAGALRELAEEVGLELTAAAILGVLDDYPTRSGYLIRPVVVWAGPEARFTRNPDEVASIHHFPLRELDRPDSPRIFSIPESDRPVIKLPYNDTEIYAPTAAMLYQFREVGVHGRHTRVDGFDQPVWAWQ